MCDSMNEMLSSLDQRPGLLMVLKFDRSSLPKLIALDRMVFSVPEVTHLILPTKVGTWRLWKKPRNRWQLRRWARAWAAWWARKGHLLARSPEMWIEG